MDAYTLIENVIDLEKGEWYYSVLRNEVHRCAKLSRYDHSRVIAYMILDGHDYSQDGWLDDDDITVFNKDPYLYIKLDLISEEDMFLSKMSGDGSHIKEKAYVVSHSCYYSELTR